MRGCLLVVFGMIVGAVAAIVGVIFMGNPMVPSLPIATPGRYDARVTLSSDFLQRQVQNEVARSSAGASFQNLTVRTDAGDQVVIVGTVARGAFQAPMRVTVQPIAQNNRVTLRVVRADLGGLPLPATFLQPLEDAMNRQLASMLGNESYQIIGITTSAEGVSIDLSMT